MKNEKIKPAQVMEVLHSILKGSGISDTIFHIFANVVNYYTNDKKRHDGKLYTPGVLEKDGFLDLSNESIIVSTTKEEENADEYFTELIAKNKRIYVSVFCGGLEIATPDEEYEHYKDYKGLPVIHPQILANVSKMRLELLPVYDIFTDEICDYVVKLPLEKGAD